MGAPWCSPGKISGGKISLPAHEALTQPDPGTGQRSLFHRQTGVPSSGGSHLKPATGSQPFRSAAPSIQMTSMKERNPFLPMDKPSFLPSAAALTAWDTVIYTIHVMMAGLGPCRETWEHR